MFPKGKINIVTLSCGIGAIVALALNLCLTPLFSHIGSAVAYLVAEVTTSVSMYYVGRKYIPIQYFKQIHLKYLLGCAIMALVLFAISRFQLPSFYELVLQGCCGVIVYFLILCLRKDSILMRTFCQNE